MNLDIRNLFQGPNLALFTLAAILLALYFGLGLSFRGAVQIS